MGLFTGAIRLLTNTRAADVAIVDGNGDQITGFDGSRPATAAITTAAMTVASAVVIAANAARRQVMVYNDSNKELYVAFDATATTAAFSVLIPANGQWVSQRDSYTGVISGILPSGTGDAIVTEITA